MKTGIIHTLLLMGLLVCLWRPVTALDNIKNPHSNKPSFNFLLIFSALDDSDSIKIGRKWIYTKYDTPPVLPGGQDGYMEYLKKNFKFHEICSDSGVQGTIYVSIIVDKDGTLSDIHIIKDKVGYGYGEEALRVFKSMSPRNLV